MDASRATSYGDVATVASRVRRFSVPAGDDGPAVGAAADLADDPRIHLALLVVRRRRDPELVEQAALDGVVVLEESVVGDVLAIRLDRFEDRAAHVTQAPRQGLAYALSDLGQRVKRTVGQLRILDALLEHLAGQAC